MNKFYCYVYLDPRKVGRFTYGDFVTFFYEPYYVGKGKGNRVYSHLQHTKVSKQNILRYIKIQKIRKSNFEPKDFIIFIEENLNEEDSFNIETNIIKNIGRKELNNGPLVNFTNGGEGQSGRILSLREKEIRSINSSNRRYIFNRELNCTKLIKSDKLNIYLNEGWILGRGDDFKIIARKSQLGKIISKESIEKRSNSRRGIKQSKETIEKRTKSFIGRLCIHLNDKKLYVKIDEVDEYYNQGWILGGIKNKLNKHKPNFKCWIKKNNIEMLIKNNLLEYYILDGWVRGRK